MNPVIVAKTTDWIVGAMSVFEYASLQRIGALKFRDAFNAGGGSFAKAARSSRVTMRHAFLLMASIGLASSAARAQPPGPLGADTPSTTAGGATFTAPKAWSLSVKASQIILIPPETDTHIVLMNVPDAVGASAAVAAAWRFYKPDLHRPLQFSVPLAAHNGWDEEREFTYETSPNEHAIVQAIAFHYAGHWTVLIVDGSESTLQKRGAATSLIMQSLRPAGYKRESFAGLSAHPLDKARVAELKSFVRDSMKQLGVPGASLAIMDHGNVVFEGGLGVKKLGDPAPVDANTLFMIASNTKGMSTLLLAELVDEGKLRWDEPVTEAYPSFRLGSASTTRKVLMKDLVCACTGLPRKDLEWELNTNRNTPASTTFADFAATEPTSDFGEVFQYNNLMAAAAGYIGGHLVYPRRELGAAYDAAMQNRIFNPLGMRDTTLDIARALSGNHASPHGDDVDGKPAVASMDSNYAIEPYRPAGGAWSSAHDMIRYVRDELTEGKLPDGRQLVSAKNLLQRRVPNVPIGEDAFYGMGLEIDNTWGVMVIHHGGSMAGFESDWVLIPSAGVGAVLLTNADAGRAMRRPFMRRLLEILYDGKPEAVGDVAAAAARNQAKIAKDRERLVVPAAPALVANLAPSYLSPELGHITVHHDSRAVVFDFGAWKSRVASRKNDDGTISFITIDPAVEGYEFVVASRSGKRVLIIRDGQHEYVYNEGA